MAVRKATGTTVSLIVFIVGIVYFLPIIRNTLPYQWFYTLTGRMYPQYAIGGFYPLAVKTAIWIILVVGILDAILRNKIALGFLSSLNIPIVLSIPVIITAFIPRANLYLFWAILQFAVIIGIYWTFRKIMHNNHPGGQKLIPFIKEIKDVGGAKNRHISDHLTVWVTCLLLLAVFSTAVISFVVYIATHWSLFT